MHEEVEFNEEQKDEQYSLSGQVNKTSTFVKWVLKTGIVKDRGQAEKILLGIVVLAIIISVFLLFSSRNNTEIPPETLINPERGYTPTDS